MQSLRKRIRQWLIDLIREAVRLELIATEQRSWSKESRVEQVLTGSKGVSVVVNGPIRIPIAETPLVSFEQLQAEALKAQEESDGKEAR